MTLGIIVDTVYQPETGCSTDKSRTAPHDCLFRSWYSVEVYGDAFDDSIQIYYGDQGQTIDDSSISLVSPTQLQFELLPLPSATSSTPYGDKVLMRLRTGSEVTPFSEPVSFTMEMFEVLVVGDSVVWGQGLIDDSKFSTRVTNYIIPKTHLRVWKTVLAHSGAVIGSSRRNQRALQVSTEEIQRGEVPQGQPSIRNQALTDFQGNPQNVKLIVIDGCINDASVMTTVVNPTIIDKFTDFAANLMCYERLKAMLEDVTDKYPCAHLIVNNYFQVISQDPRPGVVLSLLLGSATLAWVNPTAGALTLAGISINQPTRAKNGFRRVHTTLHAVLKKYMRVLVVFLL